MVMVVISYEWDVKQNVMYKNAKIDRKMSVYLKMLGQTSKKFRREYLMFMNAR